MVGQRHLWVMIGSLTAALYGCGDKASDSSGPTLADPAANPDDIGDAPGATAGTGAQTPGTDTTAPPTDASGDEPIDGTPGTTDPNGAGDPVLAYPEPRGACADLNTRFPGDDACILPPAPGEGFQIHIGPEDYEDMADVNQFVLRPGDETSRCWTYHTPNDEEIYYQGYVFSGRPGTHHVFNSMLAQDVTDGGGFRVCVDGGLGNSSGRVGGLPGAGRAYVARTPVAPENAGLGGRIPANAPAEADMHYFNATDTDILREFWLNIYYIDKSKVTDEVKTVRGMGGLSWSIVPIAPGADRVYKYECPMASAGRMIGVAGHYHAHGVRESATLRRADGTRVPLFEMYDYNEQATFMFDSITVNPEYTGSADFGYTGMLDVGANDVLEWECHIINDSSVPLRYTNSVQEGEMCNIFFGFVGGEAASCLVP